MPQPELEPDLPFPRASGATARMWDTVTFSGHDFRDEEFPGKVTVRATVGRRVDVRNARGRDGANLTDQGVEPTTVSLSFLAWKAEHFASLQGLIPRLAARQRLRDREPIDVYHPALAALGLTRVYVTKVGSIEAGSQSGTWQMEVECVEYFPPPKRRVTKGPAGNKTEGTGLSGLATVGNQPKSPRSNGAADP
jgi:hypothetical protein